MKVQELIDILTEVNCPNANVLIGCEGYVSDVGTVAGLECENGEVPEVLISDSCYYEKS